MNPYFWLFSACALLMTPLSAQISVRVGHGVRYRVRLQAAGLPFLQKREENHPEEEERVDVQEVAHGALSPELPVALSLWKSGAIRRALGTLRLESLYLHAHISFEDAAATALIYAAVRSAAQTITLCAATPNRVQGRVEADFRGEGTEVFARCMVSGRLGSLGAAALRLGWAAWRTRARLLEEDSYAAASH